METKKIKIIIPDEVTSQWLRAHSSEISRIIMKEHCLQSDKTMNLSEQKSKGVTMFRHIMLDEKVIIDGIKSKLRIFLPKTVNTLLIDQFYVNDLIKSLTEVKIEHFPTLKYRKRGLLMFPVISERKVYLIDVGELKSSWLINKDVRKNFGSTEFENRLQYEIPMNKMKSFDIPENIEFVFGEEKEEIEEKPVTKREKSYKLF